MQSFRGVRNEDKVLRRIETLEDIVEDKVWKCCEVYNAVRRDVYKSDNTIVEYLPC